MLPVTVPSSTVKLVSLKHVDQIATEVQSSQNNMSRMLRRRPSVVQFKSPQKPMKEFKYVQKTFKTHKDSYLEIQKKFEKINGEELADKKQEIDASGETWAPVWVRRLTK